MTRADAELEFLKLCETPSDINQHLAMIRAICSHRFNVTEMWAKVVEFGVRSGNSTKAILASGIDEYFGFDINPCAPDLPAFAKAFDVDFTFRQIDIRKLTTNDMPDRVDVVMIDSLHTFDQVNHELSLIDPYECSFVIFHDTHTFAKHGEDGHPPGINKAINQFLDTHSSWTVFSHQTNNHGS